MELLARLGMHRIGTSDALEGLYGVFRDGILLVRMRRAARQLDVVLPAPCNHGFNAVLVVRPNRNEWYV